MLFDRGQHRSWASDARLAAAIALALAVTPRASGTTAVLPVSATVNANCAISASAVSFGSYESLLANATTTLNAAGSVSIACTRGTVPKITMDLGRNPNGGRRYMALATGSSAGTADALYYELYQPPNSTPGTACSFPGTTAWGASASQAFTPSPTTNRSSRSFSVCGTIPAGQFVTMGSYADTVVATVNF